MNNNLNDAAIIVEEMPEMYDLNFVEVESFDEESICSLIDDEMSIPALIKEEDYGDNHENETITTAFESVSCDDCDMADFFAIDGCEISMSTQEPEDMRYNVTDITCPLCYFTVDGGEAIVVPGCGHSVCVSCFQGHIKSHHKTLYSICCPLNSSVECSKPLSRSLVQQIMATEMVTVPVEEHHLSLKSAPVYHPCPTLGCTHELYWKEGYGPPIGDCFQCNQTCCLKCGVTPYHNSQSCMEYQSFVLSRGQPGPVAPIHVVEERSDESTSRCFV